MSREKSINASYNRGLLMLVLQMSLIFQKLVVSCRWNKSVKDSVIRQVKELLEVPDKDWKNLDPKVKELLHHRKKLYVNGHGVLCRRTTNQQHEQTGTTLHNVKQNQHEHTRKTLHKVKQTVNIKQEQQKTSPDQVVWPEALCHLIYQWFHVDMGHLGVNRVVQLCRSRVFWPKMNSDIEEFISQRCQCIVQKRPGRHQEAELQSISTSAPLELITVDFLKLERGVGGYQYILLVVDHFTRYVQGYATTNKSGTTAARKIYGDFVLRFGLPSQILHDQGREFENHMFAELERLSGVQKLRTTPYHPQCNGMVERMNKTILGMLRTLPERSKSRWPESLDKLIYAYNCTTHDTTGFEPYYLMFGRRPKLPLDLILDSHGGETVSHEEYAKKWEQQMRDAYQIVKEKCAKRKQKDIDRRKGDGKKMLGDLVVGERVLVKNVRDKGGPGKLRSYWEQRVFTIIEKKSEVVYTVLEEGEKNSEKARVLHRNMLLPVSQWFELEKPKKAERKQKVNKPKQDKQKKTDRNPEDPTNMQNSENEDENAEWVAFYPMPERSEENFEPVVTVDISENEDELVESEAETEEYDEEEARQLLEELVPVDNQIENSDEVENDTEDTENGTENVNIEETRNEVGVDVGVPAEDQVMNDVGVDVGVPAESEAARHEIENPESEELGEGTANDSGRTKRVRLPARKFTYDELGVPSSVEMTNNIVGAVEAGQIHNTTSGNQHVAENTIFPDGYARNVYNVNIGRGYVDSNARLTDRHCPDSVATAGRHTIVQPVPTQHCFVSVQPDFVVPMQYVPVPNGGVVTNSPYRSAQPGSGTTQGWNGGNGYTVPESQLRWSGGHSTGAGTMYDNRQTADMTGQLFMPEHFSLYYPPSNGNYQGYEPYFPSWQN